MSGEQKLRVALCLYGQPRFHNSQSQYSLKYAIIEPYNADVFFHVWWSPDSVGEKVYPTAPHIGGAKMECAEGVLDDLLEIYKPKAYKADPPRVFDIEEHLKPSRREREIWSTSYVPANALSMYYSIKQVQEMKRAYETEHGFKYDWIVMARYDHFLPEMIDLTKLSRNYMYVPDNCPTPKACNDNFLICSSDDFDVIGKMFDEMRVNIVNSMDLTFEELRIVHLRRHKLLDKLRRVVELRRQTFVRHQ